MTDKKINYKQPSDEQLKAMQDFANVSSQLLEIVLQYEGNLALQNVTSRINEAMMWFHSYILNGGKEVAKEEMADDKKTIIQSKH